MKRWICGLVLSGFFSDLLAKPSEMDKDQSAPAVYLFIGLAVIIGIVIMLMIRQKRKFNH